MSVKNVWATEGGMSLLPRKRNSEISASEKHDPGTEQVLFCILRYLHDTVLGQGFFHLLYLHMLSL